MSKPWWFPTLVGPEMAARLRRDYSDQCDGLSDDEVLAEFAHAGRRYAVTWDDVGDAEDAYERVCDAFLSLLSAAEAARDCMFDCGLITPAFEQLTSAIAAAKGEEE